MSLPRDRFSGKLHHRDNETIIMSTTRHCHHVICLATWLTRSRCCGWRRRALVLLPTVSCLHASRSVSGAVARRTYVCAHHLYLCHGRLDLSCLLLGLGPGGCHARPRRRSLVRAGLARPGAGGPTHQIQDCGCWAPTWRGPTSAALTPTFAP
jgi:hypothetical protein